ncbi:protein spinster homolog 3-like [Asterias rubens]|uniref:protein spinster homolog 3-like n=1 Tax=Asterias rubens TaxID=7604 RepID=UPI001455220B|nr:protein spinster homolog 3-like [Asterias rubens]
MGQFCCKKSGYRAREDSDVSDVNVPTVSTPKAVLSLLIIFAVYVGVQVVSLAYPVLFPAGLRCYQNYTSTCDMNIKSKNGCQVDCIEFTDTQQGILTGLTLTAVYLIAGIPLAKATGVGSRVPVLAIGQLILTGMAILTAFSSRFFIILLARLGAGLSEAACTPAAYSLISDYFVVMNHAKALSVYHFATNIGVAAAFSLGFLNFYVCWRWVFLSLAIAGGCVFLLVIFFLREPPYDSSDSLMSSQDLYTITEVFQRLIRNRPYVYLCLASSMRNVSTYALWAWLPTFYSKVLSIPSEEYGVNIALVVLFGGGCGCAIGGILTDRISRRHKQNKTYVIAISHLTAASLMIGTLLTLSPSVSFGLLFLYCLVAEMAPGPASSIVQDLFSANLRSSAFAAYVAIGSIVGSAVGPILVPAITSLHLSWHACDQGVGVALAIVVPSFYLLSSLLFIITGFLMPTEEALNEETIYLKYETSEVDAESEAERETLFYGSLSI